VATDLTLCSLQSVNSVFLSHQISINHQPAVLSSHNKSAPATTHRTEQWGKGRMHGSGNRSFGGTHWQRQDFFPQIIFSVINNGLLLITYIDYD